MSPLGIAKTASHSHADTGQALAIADSPDISGRATRAWPCPQRLFSGYVTSEARVCRN